MRVVCAACQRHYADLDSEMPFAEKLIYSDALAEWHAPHCTATRDEHGAALAFREATETVMEAS